MYWLLQIETELNRLTPDDNPGRTRTAARRIAGIALQQFFNKPTDDFLRLLQNAVNDPSLPSDVVAAIQRLTTRLDSDFKSPSVDPISDAMSVVEFVKAGIPPKN